MPAAEQAVRLRTHAPRRLRPSRRWWLAVVIALAANAVIVVVLGQISRVAQVAAAAPAPLTVHRLTRPEPEPPPPLSGELAPAPAAHAVAEAVAPPLPLLDLPAADASPLGLPVLGGIDIPGELSLGLPVDAVAAADAAPALAAPHEPDPDTPATRLGSLDLERFYPRLARARGLGGSSRIRSHIDAAGTVTAVEVLDSHPSGVFEQAAERLGLAQRYAPARKSGTAVASVQITVIAWSLL